MHIPTVSNRWTMSRTYTCILAASPMQRNVNVSLWNAQLPEITMLCNAFLRETYLELQAHSRHIPTSNATITCGAFKLRSNGCSTRKRFTSYQLDMRRRERYNAPGAVSNSTFRFNAVLLHYGSITLFVEHPSSRQAWQVPMCLYVHTRRHQLPPTIPLESTLSLCHKTLKISWQ